jgi:hypothetical protein
MNFQFEASTFVKQGFEDSDGDWSSELEARIAQLRVIYPELVKWGDLAIGSAWGGYSQDVFQVIWVDWIDDRSNEFLSYCYYRQVHGNWIYTDDFSRLESLEIKWKS